jgi:hypothetical protein
MIKYFNLKEAQNGHPMVTRDGREATYITYVEHAYHPVVVLVDREVKSYYLNGRFFSESPSELDLFMKKDSLFESLPVVFPEPIRNPPEEGAICYAASPLSDLKWSVVKWSNDTYCMSILESGLLHKTKENAILHTNAIIKLSGGRV